MGTPRTDDMDEDLRHQVASLKDANCYSMPPHALDKHFTRKVHNICTLCGLTIFTPLSDIVCLKWNPKNAPHLALKSIAAENQVLQYIKFDGVPNPMCSPESEIIQSKLR